MTCCLACLSAVFTASTLYAEAMPQAQVWTETQASALLEGMPSFHQRNDDFAEGGRNYCGPAAASNALMWLADRGYPGLKPSSDDNAAAQKAMIKQLAGYMGIIREGATAAGFMCGVKSYLRAAGYSPKTWSASGGISANGSRTPPDLSLLGTMTAGKTVIWLGLGWYGYDPSTRKYTRSSGHWVTLVGLDGGTRENAALPGLVIADPEFPDAHQFVTLSALNDGSLSNGVSKSDTKGFFKVLRGDTQNRSPESRYGVLESIQVLTVD